MPGAPCGPGAPGDPAAPVSPIGPCGPCGPAAPVRPCRPAAPDAPGAPACAIIVHGSVPGAAEFAATGPVATYVDALPAVPPVPMTWELPPPAPDSEY